MNLLISVMLPGLFGVALMAGLGIVQALDWVGRWRLRQRLAHRHRLAHRLAHRHKKARISGPFCSSR